MDEINIYDIAKKAGTSPATVSRVLNNKPNVSEKTRKKIIDIINQENFIPNGLARGLNTSQTKNIGVLTIDIRNIHYANTAYAIEQECHANGYSMTLCNTGNDLEKKAEYLHLLAEQRVCGIIMIGSVFTDKYIETSILNNLGNIPVVFANGLINTANIHSVLVDSAYGIRLCVRHLSQQKKQHLVFIKDSETYSANEKLRGFEESMAECGLNYDERSILHTSNTLEGGYAAAEQLCGLGIPFDGIVCCEDLTALGCLKFLHEKGYRIPEDVAVTGCNNSIYAQSAIPTLTTVDNKVKLMGKLSFQLLKDLIEGNETSSNLLIRPDLVIGQST